MDPNDIPRVEVDQMPRSRITGQYLKLPDTRAPIPQFDARIAGTGVSPPPSILLDFMYGVAAYECWGGGQDISEVMQHRFAEHYESIPIPTPSPLSSDDGSSPEPNNVRDGDYKPNNRQKGRNHSSHMSGGMLDAMDNVLKLSMLLKGRTPQSVAAERERREEEEELHVQKAGQVKSQRWIETLQCVFSYL